MQNKLSDLHNNLHVLHDNDDSVIDNTSYFNDNSSGNGGGTPMNSKYVTHDELKISNLELRTDINKQFQELREDMNNNFSKINNQLNDIKLDLNTVKSETKFANMKINWILGILSAVIGGVLVAFITSLLK